MKKLVIKSYAKINIALNVMDKREDGYHELDTVMIPLELHDSVIIEKFSTKGGDNFITCDDFSTGVIKYNLATNAITKLADKYNFDTKFRIFIHKVIPLQAGLGGGSSNAAFTMLGINKMLKLNASEEDLLAIGETIGADVPFFIKNIPARCKGKGELITPITVKNNYYVLIVMPKSGNSTKEVFAVGDTLTLKTYDIDKVIQALEEGDDDLLATSIGNSLEEPAMKINPEISEINAKLKDFGLNLVLMSGSGASVFALSTNKKELINIAKKLDNFYRVELTKIRK